jgi:hypothetical protein
MKRADRILLVVAYVLLVVIAVVGVKSGEAVIDETVDRTCEIQQVQLASLTIVLKSVQLNPNLDVDVLIATMQDLRDAIKDDC